MATNLLWFVMAGFLLGFATSTLWEWFYFRKERLKLTDRRIRELEAKLRDAEIDPDSIVTNSIAPKSTPTANPIPTVAAVTGNASRTSAWGDTAYRSPGVFLESEEYEAAEGGDTASAARTRATHTPSSIGTSSFNPSQPSAPVTPPVVPTVNSLAPSNPAVSPTDFAPPTGLPSSSIQPNTPTSTPISDATFAPRPDTREAQPSPADALRAKRGNAPRSRQEVLAALRRNSEAVQRGQFPLPDNEIVLPEPQPGLAPRPVDPAPVEEAPPATATPSGTPPAAPVSPAPSTPLLSPARQRWLNNPELTQPSQTYPDDLSKIKGIGDVYKQRLYRAGIYTWRQIAEADTEALRRATSAYPSSNVDEWLVQAQKLMEKHGRKEAVYNGPRPDDMTKILGIGPVSAASLYRAGICTYEQLASTPIDDLEALFPVAVAGDQPDFDQWVARAAALADEKYGDK